MCRRIVSVFGQLTAFFSKVLAIDNTQDSIKYWINIAYLSLSRSDCLPDLDAPERSPLRPHRRPRHRREHELVDGDPGWQFNWFKQIPKKSPKYRAPLIGGPQVWWILFLLLLTTSASTCLQHSRNLGPAYKWSPVYSVNHSDRWIT